MSSYSSFDQACANAIRTLTLDAVQAAKSGHPGMPLGMADVAYVLYKKFFRYNPHDIHWFNRDRFIVSAGHGSMLPYSLLYLTGQPEMTIDEIKRFRQWGSRTPGHPENFLTPGIEVTTGPLGAGASNSVGMALAEAWLGATYNKVNHAIVNHYTYTIVSDGDLQVAAVPIAQKNSVDEARAKAQGKVLQFYGAGGSDGKSSGGNLSVN